MKEYGPDVICPTSHVVQFTHRPGNEGPFFCEACGSTEHFRLSDPEPNPSEPCTCGVAFGTDEGPCVCEPTVSGADRG
jgi:hypothetical protein